ncbi:MAG: AmmeMemoRadiSam system protein A [Coriobacteriia bacterium]|nr:AmmeMemoRadiSam system protein A [Coriobacteriia bacterium]
MGIVGAIAVPHPPLIVPAVGRGEERRIQDTIDAYRQATRALLALEPECLIVTSPHAPAFRDAFHVTTDATLKGSMSQFRAPHERLKASCDVALAQAILHAANEAGIVAIGSEYYRDDMDHATYVPLWFVREAWKEANPQAKDDLPCPIVRIGLSGFTPETHRAFGHAIARAVATTGRRVGFIASGDLSHKLLAEGPYGFAPEGPVFDARIGEIFDSGSLDGLFQMDEDFVDAAAECGLRSFQIMAGAIDGLGLRIRMLSNEGPFGVGYGVATCLPADGAGDGTAAASGTTASAPAPAIDPCVALARLSVETFVRTGRPAALPANVPAELLQRQAGVFVSLHEHGQLRGCIGTIGATCDSIAQEILQNGVSACSRDPRFDPVQPDELDFLEYSVDVLGDAEPIASPAQLDPQRYGVIVTKGWRRGLLLPNLDGVDTVEAQLAIAKQKAGIRVSDQNVQLERFEVVRHTAGGEPRTR